MICKKTTGSGFRGLANYLLAGGRGQIIAGVMAGQTPRELAREFGMLRRLNPNLGLAVAHFSLSPAPDDPPFTEEQWQDIGARFIKDMGYADAPWCGVLHRDTGPDHVHLHLMVCRIGFNAKTVPNSNDYRKAEASMRRIEADYGLRAVAAPIKEKFKATVVPLNASPEQPTSQGGNTMTDSHTTPTPPNPFDPSDSQHATWPEPFEPGRDLAELAIVSISPSIVMPGASPAELLTDSDRRNMRRALVEADYVQRMQTLLGDDLTRVHKHAQGATLYFKQPGRIADQGDKLTVLGGMEEKLAAQRIVALACEKRWVTITFTGSGSFVERAMREALKQHMTVVPNSPGQAAILAKLVSERQGGMGSAIGPVATMILPLDPALTILSELDELPPQPWHKTAPTPKPVESPADSPPASLIPQPPMQPVLGVLPAYLNLRERLQSRRQRHAPATPAPTQPATPKKPGGP